MNVILIEPEEANSLPRVRLSGRKALHIRRVLRAARGDVLRVGLLGGRMGTGAVLSISDDVVEMDLVLSADPPPPVGVTLALAMPRPKSFRRILQAVTTLGVKRMAIFGAYRVEKSYWETPWLADDSIREQVLHGLEQAGDTIPPVVTVHPQFKPFVEDVLPALARGTQCLAAHPGAALPCPTAVAEPISLVVGPEGGFTAYEVELLQHAGFNMVSLGRRILRVEQAVPYLMGRLLPL